jgi:hypothetical protein
MFQSYHNQTIKIAFHMTGDLFLFYILYIYDIIVSRMRKIIVLLLILATSPVTANQMNQTLDEALIIVDTVRITCSDISDKIAKISKISKANTAVTSIGTLAAGGALAVGIRKARAEQAIDCLIGQICEAGGCSYEGVNAMSNEDFFNNVIQPLAKVAELTQDVKDLQTQIDKAKNLGNWRTGLSAATIGTNLASAIMSGVNINQSELSQKVSACNTAVKQAEHIRNKLLAFGASPSEHSIIYTLNNINTRCGKINPEDITKIENRTKGVMGTSIVGTVIGTVGTGTSAAANSDKYTNISSKVRLTEEEQKKEDILNTTANVMAGANTATGLVETGLNISLITLTKRLIAQAERCEEIFK